MFVESYNNLNVKAQVDDIIEQGQGQRRKKYVEGVVVEKNHNNTASQSAAASAEIMHYRLQRARERAREAEMNEMERIVKKFIQENNKKIFEEQRLKRLIPQEQRNDKNRQKRIKKFQNQLKNKLKYQLKKKADTFNAFTNDGNFMEQFLKMQESQNQQQSKQLDYQ